MENGKGIENAKVLINGCDDSSDDTHNDFDAMGSIKKQCDSDRDGESQPIDDKEDEDVDIVSSSSSNSEILSSVEKCIPVQGSACTKNSTVEESEDWDNDIETNYGQFEDAAGSSNSHMPVKKAYSMYQNTTSYHYYLPAEDHRPDTLMGWQAVSHERRKKRYARSGRHWNDDYAPVAGQFDDHEDDDNSSEDKGDKKQQNETKFAQIPSLPGLYFSK